MASKDELLISRSIILRSVRAVEAGSKELSCFPGLMGKGLVVTEEPLLNIRGRRVGMRSEIVAGTPSVLSVVETMKGLARSPSEGVEIWLVESTLDDFRCCRRGNNGGRSGA